MIGWYLVTLTGVIRLLPVSDHSQLLRRDSQRQGTTFFTFQIHFLIHYFHVRNFSQNNHPGAPLLDTVVGTLYSGTGDQQKMAQEVLTTLKEHPDAWTKVRTLLIF